MPWNPLSSVTGVPSTSTRPLAGVNWRASICSKAAPRILALVLSVAALPATGKVAEADAPSLDHLITKVALQENVDPALLRAVVATESDFNPETVSPDGAVGLMQLMPETARLLGVKNIYNPEQNLRGGARYLGQMLKQFPKIPHALAAYNAGPTMVARFQGVPPVPETQRYVGKVLNHYKNSPSQKHKKLMAHKKGFNGTVFLADARESLAVAPRSGVRETQPGARGVPLLTIRRTNTQVRHEMPPQPILPPAKKSNGRAAQFAMALSTVDGESVPVLRASR